MLEAKPPTACAAATRAIQNQTKGLKKMKQQNHRCLFLCFLAESSNAVMRAIPQNAAVDLHQTAPISFTGRTNTHLSNCIM